MRNDRMFRKITNGEAAIGSWMTLSDPGIPIILSDAGFDWILIDTEHNPFTDRDLQGIVHAMRATDVTPIIRVRDNNIALIKIALDVGAGGVVVPLISSAEDARRAVDHAKYHPLGKRGYSPLRATDFWKHRTEYDEYANRELLLICQIETAEAVEAADDIMEVEGVDAIYIGPSDLSHSMGYKGDMKQENVRKAIDSVISAAQKHNMPWGMPTGTPEDFVIRITQGARLPTLGSDNRFIKLAAAATLSDALAALGDV